MGEKFAANPVTGTGSLSIPISVSPGRAGFGPQLSLGYDSAAGNGPFGFGWSLSIPAITRKTDKGLPRYHDADESDVFLLSGAEDLVPLLDPNGARAEDTTTAPGYTIQRYRPRIEGLFARIERWTRRSGDERDGEVHWRSISRDNVQTMYGRDENSRIADPTDPHRRIFTWLICETRDDRGNAIVYEYKPEDGAGIDLTRAHERNRGVRNDPRREVNRYIKRIRYGNRTSLLDDTGQRPRLLTDPPQDRLQNIGWMFEAVFDYGEHPEEAPTPRDSGEWICRADPFSSYRAGFEVRASRLCRRVLMFHHFGSEAGVGNDCLVRSTDFTYSDTRASTDARNPVYTFLLAATQTGYKRNGGRGYLKRSLPPVEFEYTRAGRGRIGAGRRYRKASRTCPLGWTAPPISGPTYTARAFLALSPNRGAPGFTSGISARSMRPRTTRREVCKPRTSLPGSRRPSWLPACPTFHWPVGTRNSGTSPAMASWTWW